VKPDRRRLTCLLAVPLVAAGLTAASDASAARSLEEYRYFRTLSIDLMGRMPTRAEVAAFEGDAFDVNTWIDDSLDGPAYAERVRRIYMDLMRLEIGGSFNFNPGLTTLRRKTITGPDGSPLLIYFREGQRRTREATDNTFCLTPDETGYTAFPRNREPEGTGAPVAQAVLDQYTVVVKPWWLYSDYKAASPKELYNAAEWATKFPGFVPVTALHTLNGMPVTSIRVCKEEAQKGETGKVFAPGRVNPPNPAHKRVTNYTTDSKFAKMNVGQTMSCLTGSALANSDECGCGPGLERCMPGATAGNDPAAFMLPQDAPLGVDQPFNAASLAQSAWTKLWWSEEATHFMDDIVAEDRDFREILTGKATLVNGPLAMFYKSIAPATCCGGAAPSFGSVPPDPPKFYTKAEALLDPSKLPDTLPHDTDAWVRVEDRGPLASGILTMPIFLTKYGSRRARAHVLYNVFLCREFISETAELVPSENPDLMTRSGCSDCHATLEPLSSYFSRIVESDWTYLPKEHFPIDSNACYLNAEGKPVVKGGGMATISSSDCNRYYDLAFSDTDSMKLRGAYASTANADAGPAGLAETIVTSPDFPVCVARNIASSFLGRALTSDDADLQQSLSEEFVLSGYRIRALVAALVRSEAYREANNLSSNVWRSGGEP
jgi:hypothetical protein